LRFIKWLVHDALQTLLVFVFMVLTVFLADVGRIGSATWIGGLVVWLGLAGMALSRFWTRKSRSP